MSARTTTKRAEEVELKELDAIVEKTRTSPLDEEQHRKLKAAIGLLGLLSAAIAAKNASIRRLKKLLFGPKSEKTSKILGNSDDAKDQGGAELGSKDSNGQEAAGGHGGESGKGSGEEAVAEEEKKERRKGHGRIAAEEYTAAERIYIAHESLEPGDPCPDILCQAQGGKVYSLKDPSQVVRILGQAALLAVIYLLERLRCHLCGKIYTAKLPEDVGTEKYHMSAVSMMAILRYGAGLPLNRLAQLQSDLGVPLPPSTQ